MSNQLTTKQNANVQGAQRAPEKERPGVRPLVDVFENESEFLVVADMPGIEKDALELTFEGGQLRLQARREPPALGTGVVWEYGIADFRRGFAMPDGIDGEKIEAELANGVLRVHLPKSAAKRPRKIPVRVS